MRGIMNEKDALGSDRGSVPKYHVVKQALLRQLKVQMIKPQEKLPTEKELEEQFQVSRITIRRALAELENEGYIYKIQGKGSFANDRFGGEKTMHHGHGHSHGHGHAHGGRQHAYQYQIESYGYQYKREFIAARRIPCPADEAQLFQIQEGELVLCIERAHLANEEVAVFVKSFLHPQKAKKVEEHNFITQSLLQAFMESFEGDLYSEGRRVNIEFADQNLAECMHVKEGYPLLKYSYQTTISGDDSKIPIECAIAYYRTDIVEFLPDVEKGCF